MKNYARSDTPARDKRATIIFCGHRYRGSTSTYRIMITPIRVSGTHTHRALALRPPDPSRPPRDGPAPKVIRRRDILGGIIHEYEAVAA
jgi:hypothetical protein